MLAAMDRIAGIETEYGCLVSSGAVHPNGDAWPVRVKNHLFRRMRAGAIDLHYRDYEEPPGNGGFLRNGGRIYLDMGHIDTLRPSAANCATSSPTTWPVTNFCKRRWSR